MAKIRDNGYLVHALHVLPQKYVVDKYIRICTYCFGRLDLLYSKEPRGIQGLFRTYTVYTVYSMERR